MIKMKLKRILAWVCVLCLISGCSQPGINKANTEHSKDKADVALEIMKGMSLEQMVYQMMFITPEALTGIGTVIQAGDTTKNALANYPVGGLIYFAPSFKNREQTKEMLANTQSFSEIPLFISVDEEGGRVARLGNNPEMGVTQHPPMREIGDSGDTESAYKVGETLGKELSELGFNVDFAPDADVIINENNSEIGDRSFGTDPQIVADMTAQVVRGMQKNNVSATIKHFPGHGSTSVDSHTGYSASNRSIDELRENEWLPFKAGIDAKADFVMVSHMTLTEATKEKLPSSLSKEVITDMLKGELGYKGIVITDSFSMGAIIDGYSAGEAAVKAVSAGADMILMSADFKAAHTAIVQAVINGELTRERIEESVYKILSLKVNKGLLK